MTLELDKHPCHIGKSFSGNTEHHGEDDVSAIDLNLDGIMLTAAELDGLLGNGAHKALYIYPAPKDDAPPEVRFPMLNPLSLKVAFEHATVRVCLGYDEETVMHWQECKISKIVLTPQAGGLTQMKCSIRARPDSDDVAALYEDLNSYGAIAIAGAHKAKPKKENDKQTNLPLGEQPDPDATNGENDASNEAA